jgi:hypothetical protein
MRYILTGCLFLIVIPGSICGQSGPKSPKEVVEEFWRLETQGVRLTEEGWRTTDHFFAHPIPAPSKRTIAVISQKYKYSIDELHVKGNQAEIEIAYVDLGEIDDTLRYRPPGASYTKPVLRFHVVLTDGAGTGGREGSSWKIEKPGPIMWVTLDTAIRYLTLTRGKSTDTAIRKNADRTLAELASLN